MARTRGFSMLVAVVLLIGLFFAGTGLFFAGTGLAAAEDWEDVLEDGGEYDDDIELDEDGATYDPDDVAEVDGDITISGDDITLRNVKVYGDLIIEGDYVELEDVEVSGDVEIYGEEASLDDVEIGNDCMVEGEDAVLENVTIEGDMHIEEDVEENFSGQTVTVEGTVFVNGGGSDSVHFENAALNHLEIDSEDVHVRLSGKTKVAGNVTVREPGTVTLEDTAAIQGNVTINAESTFYLNDSSKMTGTVTVNRGSSFELEAGASIKRMDVKDDGVELLGNGTIEALYAEDEDDVDIDNDLTIKAFNEPVEEPSEDGGAVIAAGKSGTVRYGNDVTVQIPAGATDVDIEVTIREATNVTDIPASLKRLSPVFELKRSPDGMFKKPVTVAVAFDADQLASGERPEVYYYDEIGKTWRAWGGFVNSGKMTVYVDRFAKLAVFAEKTVQPAPQPVTPQQPAAPAFSDIRGHWAEKQIRKAAELGIVKGYQDGTFRPNEKVNRLEFAVMLARLKNLPASANPVLPFKDADRIPAWARGIVASAVESRLVLGDAAGNFNPTAHLTRVQMAVMIARAAGLKTSVAFTGQLPFADASAIPDWAKSSVASVTQAGLMSGSGGKFMPKDLATRAQVVAVLVQLAER